MATDPSEKVGSDKNAAMHQGGKGDFGIPVHTDIVRDREDPIVGRPAGSAPGYTGDRGQRTTGVGSMGGEPGHDSGGDLDTDVIGFGTAGGLSARTPQADHLGADVAGEPTDTFASGGHANPSAKIRPGSHGASPRFKGDVLDHSGTDSSTTNPNAAGSAKPIRADEPGAEGEVSMDEATGDVDQGAEI